MITNINIVLFNQEQSCYYIKKKVNIHSRVGKGRGFGGRESGILDTKTKFNQTD